MDNVEAKMVAVAAQESAANKEAFAAAVAAAAQETEPEVLTDKEQRERKLALLKQQHGKLYVVSTELTEDDEHIRTVEYVFHRPAPVAYDRYVKTASKGMNKALQAFLLDSVVPDDEERLTADMEEYPALALGIGQKLLALMGLSDNVNLTKL